MTLDLLPATIRRNYEVHEWKHACAILKTDFSSELKDVIDLLMQFRLNRSWLTTGGGNKSQVSISIDSFLNKRGWQEKEFATSVHVDE
jgi:hypothetical protein